MLRQRYKAFKSKEGKKFREIPDFNRMPLISLVILKQWSQYLKIQVDSLALTSLQIIIVGKMEELLAGRKKAL